MRTLPTKAPTDEVIVFTLVSTGGGIDGRDHLDKGGNVMAASYSRAELENSGNAPWGTVVAQVVDRRSRRRAALAKLDPIDKLVLGIK